MHIKNGHLFLPREASAEFLSSLSATECWIGMLRGSRSRRITVYPVNYGKLLNMQRTFFISSSF